MKYYSNEKGSALLITLALMAMITLAAIVALDRSTTDVEMSFNQLHEEQAFYCAESGAKRAVAKLESNNDWDTGFVNESLGNGFYSVILIDSSTQAGLDDSIILECQGNMGDAETNLEVWVAPEKIHPFSYAMAAKDNVDIRNSLMTDSYNSDSGTYATTVVSDEYGDVGSNGTIYVKNGAVIGGDVVTSLEGGLTVVNLPDVRGDTSTTAPEFPVPSIPQAEYDEAEINNDNLTGITGSYTYNSTTHTLTSTGTVELTGGTYYFSDITLFNTANLVISAGATAVIYVTGDIEVKNSAAINTGGVPSDLLIYSQGDLVLKNSGDIVASYYGPEGDVDLRNSGEFYGSIVGNTIVGHNSANFHYDRELGKITKGTTGKMIIVAWKEIDD